MVRGNRYISGAFESLEQYIKDYGEDGKAELNKLASSHTITMDVTSKPGIRYTGCEIVGGVLRILFVKDMLGTNIGDSLNNLLEVVNQAGISSNDASLDFNARYSIKTDYEPEIGAVQARFQKILATPTFDIEPNFERNYAAVLEYNKKTESPDQAHRDWQKKFGAITLLYFSDFVETMENNGWGDDEMIREGITEAVEKNQIAVRIVNKLSRKHTNECVIEHGVLYIQMTAKYWSFNIDEPASELIDIL